MNTKKSDGLVSETMTVVSELGFSPQTLRGFRETYAALQRFCGEVGIDCYDESVGERFIDTYRLRQPQMAKETIQNYRRHIRRLNCALLQIEWKPSRKKPDEYAQSCYDDVVAEYEAYLHRTDKTVRDIRSRIHKVSRFLRFLEQRGQTNMKNLTAKDVYEAFEDVGDKGGFSRLVGAFLEYAYKYGLTNTNLRIFMPRVSSHKTIPSVYTPTEVEQVLAAVDRTTATGKRDYAILLIAARLGLRASDIAGLTFVCLYDRTSMIKLVQEKTNVPIKLPLLDEVKSAIDDYVANGRPVSDDNHIFINFDGHGAISSQTVAQVARIAFTRSGVDYGKRRIGSHALRASLGTALLDEGNDYAVIQKTLGHRDIQSTKAYVKADIEKLRVNALPVSPPAGKFKDLITDGIRRRQTTSHDYSSVLSGEILDFMELRKSQGIKDETNVFVLANLDKYLTAIGATEKELSPNMVDKWSSGSFGHLSAKSIGNYISYYNSFAKYLNSLGIPAFIAESPLFNQRYVPYIFTEQELESIFHAADNRKATCDQLTRVQFPMFLRIMYGCGLRVGEALALRLSDVDFANGTLFIKCAKGNKDRLVPMDETLTDILKTYCDSIIENNQSDVHLFATNIKKSSLIGQSRSPSWAQHNFRETLEGAGIDLLEVFAGERNICLYCLRHTFAVNSFRKQGVTEIGDSRVTPLLSIYMGHEELEGTEKYLHMSAENAEDILSLTVACSQGLFPEVPNER
jgi:site-specific recombinase XerD